MPLSLFPSLKTHIISRLCPEKDYLGFEINVLCSNATGDECQVWVTPSPAHMVISVVLVANAEPRLMLREARFGEIFHFPLLLLVILLLRQN